MDLTDFDLKLKDQLAILNEQFEKMNQELKAKKEIFIEMYQKDPRISHDEAVLTLEKKIQDFDPFNPQEITELGDVDSLTSDSDTDVFQSLDMTSDSDSLTDISQTSSDLSNSFAQIPKNLFADVMHSGWHTIGSSDENETSGNEENAAIICKSFSNNNYGVDVSSCKRIVKNTSNTLRGYCFLNHPKIEQDQVLQWKVRVPKFHNMSYVGMVIMINK